MDLDLRVTEQEAKDLQVEMYAATGKQWPLSKSDLDLVDDGADVWLLGSMPVALLLDQQKRGPGKWGDKNGNPVWIVTPAPAKPEPKPASGAGLLGGAGTTGFGDAKINAAPQGSSADLARQIIANATQIIQNGGK